MATNRKRIETQRQQREARGKGLHPRSLARSVAKAMGAGKEWREKVAELPRTGRSRIHPKEERKCN